MSNQQDGGDASRDIKVRGGMEVKQAQVNHAEVLNVEELASRRTEEQGYNQDFADSNKGGRVNSLL